jgi:hypothetical protein
LKKITRYFLPQINKYLLNFFFKQKKFRIFIFSFLSKEVITILNVRLECLDKVLKVKSFIRNLLFENREQHTKGAEAGMVFWPPSLLASQDVLCTNSAVAIFVCQTMSFLKTMICERFCHQ